MRYWRWMRSTAVLLACIGLLIPAPCLQAAEVGVSSGGKQLTAASATDIRLHRGGVLHGQAIDGNGAPLPKTEIAVLQEGRTVRTITTDAEGRFTVAPLGGGIYHVVGAGGVQTVRAWLPGTAPPNARDRMLLVSHDDVLRGQIHPMATFLSNPWVITGIVLVAVAVPVAIHNNRNDRPSGS